SLRTDRRPHPTEPEVDRPKPAPTAKPQLSRDPNAQDQETSGYGIQPLGVTSRTVPGQCKGRAHRRSTLGLPGRRVLVSRKWSGKTLADHRADRKAFVAQALAAVGIDKPPQDTSRLIWRKLTPGDPNVPPRAHLLLQAIAQRIAWRAEYDRALLAAAGPPGGADVSTTPRAA
ncbi:MAG: replication initiator, partial [Pseudonocardiaceae bacterium]